MLSRLTFLAYKTLMLVPNRLSNNFDIIFFRFKYKFFKKYQRFHFLIATISPLLSALNFILLKKTHLEHMLHCKKRILISDAT